MSVLLFKSKFPAAMFQVPLTESLVPSRGTGAATFTRATVGNYLDATEWKQAAIDAARHHFSTGAVALGVLIEGARTNLALNSCFSENTATADLRWPRGNPVAVADHLGSMLTLDGINQDASRIDSGGESANLDLSTLDGVLMGTIKMSDVAAEGVLVIKKLSAVSQGEGYGARINSSGQLIGFISDDTAIVVSTGDGADLRDGLLHTWIIFFDRSGNMTRYVDRVAYGTADLITGAANSASNTRELVVGAQESGVNYIEGQIGHTVVVIDSSPTDYSSTIAQIAADWNRNPYAIPADIVAADVEGDWFNGDQDGNDDSGNAYTLTLNNTPTWTAAYEISPRVYEHINQHQGTIEAVLKTNWDGDDGNRHFVIDVTQSGNRIRLEKFSSDSWLFAVTGSDGVAHQTTITAAGTVAGAETHLVARWSTHDTVDGSNYVKITLDGVDGSAVTTTPAAPSDVKATLQIGQDDAGANGLDGLVSLRIEGTVWTDAYVTARYNSGAPLLYVPNSHTLAYGPAENGEDGLLCGAPAVGVITSSDNGGAAGVGRVYMSATDLALPAFAASKRILLDETHTRTDVAGNSETGLIASVEVDHLLMSAALGAITYATGTGAKCHENIALDGNAEGYGEQSTESSAVVYKDRVNVLDGAQSYRVRATGNGGYGSLAATVVAGETYVLISSQKGSAAGHKTRVNVYDVTNAAYINNPAYVDNSAAWLEETVTFEVPAGCASVRIEMQIETSGEAANFDSISLVHQLVDNPSFEIWDGDDDGNATLATSGAGTTFGAADVVDGAPWDLSTVTVGMIAKVATSAAYGYITGVNDGTDTITVEDASGAAGWEGTPVNGQVVTIFGALADGWGNSGAESGELRREATIVNSGSFSGRINADAANEGFLQAVTMGAAWYRMAGRVYPVSGAGHFQVFGVTPIPKVISTGTGAWEMLAVAWLNDSTHSVGARSDGAAAELLFDDISVLPLFITAASTSTQVAFAQIDSFHWAYALTGTPDSWTEFKAGDATVVSSSGGGWMEAAISGKNILLTSGTGAEIASIWQAVTVAASTKYAISVGRRDTSTGHLRIRVYDYENDGYLQADGTWSTDTWLDVPLSATSGLFVWADSAGLTYLTTQAGCANLMIEVGTDGAAVGSGSRVYFAQLEAGEFGSSIIKTTTAGVARTADVLSYPSTGNLNAAQGTIVVDVTPLYAAAVYTTSVTFIDTRAAGLADGIIGSFYHTSDSWRVVVRSGGADVADITTAVSIPVRDTTHRLGFAWKVNDFELYAQGASDGTPGTSGAVPTAVNANMYMGSNIASTSQLFGTVRNLRIYSERLTTAQIANLGSA